MLRRTVAVFSHPAEPYAVGLDYLALEEAKMSTGTWKVHAETSVTAHYSALFFSPGTASCRNIKSKREVR